MGDILKITSKNLITIAEEASLAEAQTLMRKMNIRHLPVTNEQNHLVGLISDRDLQRAMQSKLISTEIGEWERTEFDPLYVVADYMAWPIKTVPSSATVKTVADLMLKEKISSYLVTENNQVIGIVTTDDMLKYLVKTIGEQHTTWQQSVADLFSLDKAGVYAQTLADSGI